MNKEFKITKGKSQTVYTLESASSGGTSSGSIASVSSPMGGVRKRGGNLIAQEASKDKVPASTPRNFVAKNAKTGGAGAHKDKKKEQKQGNAKHKKPYMEELQDRLADLKSKVVEGYKVVPGIDKERYQERPGLEGPFHTKSGKVVYYDKREGKYYDPDSDFYISHDDWQAMNQGVAEAAKWRTHPDAHDLDTDGSYIPKGGIKSDNLAIRQGASKTQSEKDPKSMAGMFGHKYAKKHGVPTKQLMKNIPLDKSKGVAEGSLQEFDPGEGGFGPFKLFKGDRHRMSHIGTYKSLQDAEDELEFQKDLAADEGSVDYYKIIDGTGEQVGGFDPDASYDAMRSSSKIKYRKSGEQGVAEGEKVDRQASHITKSMMKKGKSKKDAEGIAWAHIKHPKNESVDPYFESLDNKLNELKKKK